MTYRIIYTQGNGYGCSCCRKTWTDYEDLDTKGEVIEFISKREAIERAIKEDIYPGNRDDDDFHIEAINEVREDISNNFSVDEKQIEEKMKKWREVKEKKDEKERKLKEQREKEEYKRLQEKFEG